MTDYYTTDGPPPANAAVCTLCGVKAAYPKKDVDTDGHWVDILYCTNCHRVSG